MVKSLKYNTRSIIENRISIYKSIYEYKTDILQLYNIINTIIIILKKNYHSDSAWNIYIYIFLIYFQTKNELFNNNQEVYNFKFWEKK